MSNERKIKCVLVGDHNVGKTSLILTFLNDGRFPDDVEFIPISENHEPKKFEFGDNLDKIAMTDSIRNAQINHGINNFMLAD